MSNRSRKTTSVLAVLNRMNTQLARTDEFMTKDFKKGICCAIEMILHETNNYMGFCFISNNDMEHDTLGYYSRCYFVNRALK